MIDGQTACMPQAKFLGVLEGVLARFSNVLFWRFRPVGWCCGALVLQVSAGRLVFGPQVFKLGLFFNNN
jgi:hypothetical protein